MIYNNNKLLLYKKYFFVILLYIKSMRRDYLSDKYIILLNEIIADYDKNKNEKRGRKNKFNNLFYLKRILSVLLYNHAWESIDTYDLCHYTTFKKKFYNWANLGFFNIAYKIMFEKYSKNRTFKNMFVDSTIIQNYNCSDSDYIDYYYKIVSKKQMKLSVICDSNKIPLVYELSKPQKSDIKGCIDMIPKINNNLKKKSFIMGDKGYVVNKKYYRNKNKNIKIVSNKRKNQLKQNTEKEKNLLKKRYLVENCFATIKNSYKRIGRIYDRKIKYFENFLTMAFTCQIIMFLENPKNK
jgi:hypothetical protein